MAKFFISYRREDSAPSASRLAEQLRENFGEDQIFIDENIEPGADFIKEIESAVGSSDVLLAIIGKSWSNCVNSDGVRRLDDETDYVRLEIATALSRKIRVVPVLVQGAQMPNVKELPPNLLDLGRRNGVFIREASFRRDVNALISDLNKKHFLNLKPGLRRRLVWLTLACIVMLGGVFLFTHPTVLVKSLVSRQLAPPAAHDFKVKLSVHLNEQCGPVDKAPNMMLRHRLPKDRGTNALEVESATGEKEFEYDSPIIMPSKGEIYSGYLFRHASGDDLRQGLPSKTDVCFERKVDVLAREPIVRMKCEEGKKCSVAKDDFGWAKSCPDGISWLVPSAYAANGEREPRVGWIVPSLETLRKEQAAKVNSAFTMFTVTSGPLPSLNQADNMFYAIIVNGKPIYVDGLPPDTEPVPFNADKGVNVEFGLVNLDFSGMYAGYEDIELVINFNRGKHLVGKVTTHLRYVALRSQEESKATSDSDNPIKWKAVYFPGQHDDIYQIFLMSTTERKEAEDLKRRIDRAKLNIDDSAVVAVLRPPLGKNRIYGVAVGIRQSSGQVKFTFDDETSRRLCRGVSRLATTTSLINRNAFRRNVDDRRDSKQCVEF